MKDFYLFETQFFLEKNGIYFETMTSAATDRVEMKSVSADWLLNVKKIVERRKIVERQKIVER